VFVLAKLYVVGIGPGEYESMTMRAINTINKCNKIFGYTVYCDILKENFSDKEYVSTAMKKEKERCYLALETAKKEDCAIISSGDAQVYALASLVLEMSKDFNDVEVEIIPGITAAISGGAVLGAPMGHDFCTISLSDLLTPMEVIEKRLKAAAEGDFCISIYNPSSIKRHDHLKKACNILMQYKSKDTVCGIVKNIGRKGEYKEIMTLEELYDYNADMFTTVFIGNSKTYVLNGRMVTPRGYIL